MVAGLTLAAASAVSHDLYASVIARGRASEHKEVLISKMAAVAIGVVAIVLGYVFQKQNVAFMVGLAFAVAASCNFPVLLMSIMWGGTNDARCRGRRVSRSRQCGRDGGAQQGRMGDDPRQTMMRSFPMTIRRCSRCRWRFIGIWLVSTLDKSQQAQRERAAFAAQFVRSEDRHRCIDRRRALIRPLGSTQPAPWIGAVFLT